MVNAGLCDVTTQRRYAMSVRAGVTLVELLVVIFILLAITATAIPVVVPSLQERQMREASRLVTSYFAGARDQAMHRGRPVGVMIERFPGQSEMAFVLSEVEVPPPYAGDTTNARVTVKINGVTGDGSGMAVPQPGKVVLEATPSPSGTLTPQLLRVGDVMIIGNQGHRYRIFGPTDPNDVERRITDPSVANPVGIWLELDLDVVYPAGGTAFWAPLPWSTTPSAPQPYKIIRTPKKTSRQPLVLPEGLCIDLQFSGDDDEFFVATDFDVSSAGKQDPTPVIVMFQPTGTVERIYHSKDDDPDPMVVKPVFKDHAPAGAIHFLLGQREKVPVDGTSTNKSEEDTNLLTLGNRWITIDPQTGLVRSSPVASVDPMFANSDWGQSPGDFSKAVIQARQNALSGRTEGGR